MLTGMGAGSSLRVPHRRQPTRPGWNWRAHLFSS